jgi:hypothetical protein
MQQLFSKSIALRKPGKTKFKPLNKEKKKKAFPVAAFFLLSILINV